LAQNPNVLAFGFTKKHEFAVKIDWNSVFLGHKLHIPDQLYIVIPYVSFMGFKKQILAQNTKGFAFGFTKKNGSLRQKLTKTLYFLVVKAKF
jgi:hypothetical protein